MGYPIDNAVHFVPTRHLPVPHSVNSLRSDNCANTNDSHGKYLINFVADERTIKFWSRYMMDVRFQHPCTMIVSGPTSSGKTQWTIKLLRNIQDMFDHAQDHVYWCYSEYQDIFDTLRHVKFIEGLPDPNIFDPKQRHLVVIDDLMSETDSRVTKLFTKGSHHRNVTVIFIVQNFFAKNPEMRTISLNAHYLVLFKNPRDATQVVSLAKQMFPGNGKFLQEAYADATKEPFGYLLVDLRQSTPEHMRLRTSIFPDETQYVYIPKKLK